ncbi:hypothetical protein TNIN_391031 [Trichonephila inaurata madagascariensis]|uniref:Uncharacterized protein n=1 Tax=Trichonephila inaurata madagascariensis TaxID=2747483 RepID=A0A8X7CH20_9ARAC|nr:hypothetical protein TNIN_391031 [Trichonephila inaurata madagascariensis]
MLTRSRSRQLQEQSRDGEAPPSERILETSNLMTDMELEFKGIGTVLKGDFQSIRQRAGVTDEQLVNLGQLGTYNKAEFHLEELLGTFEELGLAFGGIVKSFFDIKFKEMLQVIVNIGNLVRFYVIPRQYRERVEITKECLITFLKAILIVIAFEILIVFPDYYFSAVSKTCKNTIYTFQTTALILVIYIFLNFYLVFYTRKSKRVEPVAEEA